MKKVKKSVRSKPARKLDVVVPTKKKDMLTPQQRKKQIAASTGNYWWMQRAKHGREKLFATPALLLEAAMDYFKWCDDNPETKAELVKYEGDAEQVEVDLRRPYLIGGLCIFLGTHSTYFYEFRQAVRAKILNGNATQEDKDFSHIINYIDEVIKSQQITGALSGHFNANIISRLLGLVEKKDVTSGDAPINAPVIKVYNNAPPLAGTEDEIVP